MVNSPTGYSYILSAKMSANLSSHSVILGYAHVQRSDERVCVQSTAQLSDAQFCSWQCMTLFPARSKNSHVFLVWYFTCRGRLRMAALWRTKWFQKKLQKMKIYRVLYNICDDSLLRQKGINCKMHGNRYLIILRK